MDLILLLTILVIIILAAGGFIYYQNKFLVTSKPDEWMLVIRNGKVIQQGVGISVVLGLSD